MHLTDGVLTRRSDGHGAVGPSAIGRSLWTPRRDASNDTAPGVAASPLTAAAGHPDEPPGNAAPGSRRMMRRLTAGCLRRESPARKGRAAAGVRSFRSGSVGGWLGRAGAA